MNTEIDLPLSVKRRIRAHEDLAKDLQLLEVEPERLIKYRPGYLSYLRSPKHDLELFLDKLDSKRRRF